MKLSVYGDKPTVWTNLARVRNCATELPLVHRVHSGSLAMPSAQCRPMVLFAGKYRWNVEINCRSPSSDVAENFWKYTSI